MRSSARVPVVTLALLTLAFAGCVAPGAGVEPAAVELPSVDGVLPISVENVMGFTQSFVSPAIGTATDLYEPTMEVSDTGTIYVAGHTILAATTGTPAYYSNDDGKTWQPLPFLAGLQTPPPGQGSQPPPGDEGFIVAGENGQAWMADIYLAGFSITGWCGDGATQCYDNRNAYDRVATLTAPCDAQASLNDRPWAAYASGSLLLVNNPGGGPMQIGIMDVPPAGPVGLGGGAASVNGPTWNYCASEDGWIPGIPSMRADGLFAVPQIMGSGDDSYLGVVIGNKADIFTVETVKAFDVTSIGAGTSNGGRTAFDKAGTLFVGAKNNTRDEGTEVDSFPLGTRTAYEAVEGRFKLALSTDDGKSFREATFRTGAPVQSLYLDGNMNGAGALLVWSQVGETDGKADWYVAHVHVGACRADHGSAVESADSTCADGAPELRNVTQALDEADPYSAHVIGAAVGPDGRAYFLNFKDGAPQEYAGSTPISVWIQQDGPTLPME